MLKHGTDKLIKMLTWVINRCLNGEETPQQWKVLTFHQYTKKEAKNCSNCRGISVTSVMSRLYGKILRDLIEEENKDEEEQSGFLTGRSCTDNIFCMKQVIEKRNSTNQETHLLFVDLTKTYDRLPISKLWEVLGESNINNTLIKALQNLYGNTAQVKIRNILSHPFNITKELRQGCCISPTLFKIYIRKALEEWKRKCSRMGIPLENITLCTHQFADDQVVLAGDKGDLEYVTRKLKETYEKWGLDMNLNKTKYLCIGESHSNLKLDKDSEIQFCQEYKYLGVIFDTSGTDDKEIRPRVIKARKCIAFFKRDTVE